MPHPRLRRPAALALPALLALPRDARAAWPDRPVRLVAPFPAGSGTDVLARLLAEPLSERLGQTVVVENRPGGNGVVGSTAVATGPADGNTLLMLGTSAAAINPHIVRRLPYDPIRDFAPIGSIAEQPYILVVPPDAHGSDLRSWLTAARARPDGVTLAYGNAGSQVMAAMLARGAAMRLTAVPYRGSAEAITDVSVGRVDCTFADFGIGMAQHRGGRVRPLAQTSAAPFPLAPEVPPLASEVPGFDANVWFSVVAAAATPPEVVERASTVLDGVLAAPQFQGKLANLGLAPLRMGPAALRAHLQRQLALWGERVRLAGIEPQ
jgi:tripartite-type tricarboxylate transporter receptor subunit TctC